MHLTSMFLIAASFFFLNTTPACARNPILAADSLLDKVLDHFEFLPEYHMEAELSTFLFHKNSFFKERYFFENNMYFEFSFISINKLVYSTWGFQLFTGAGQVPGNVAFSLLDIDFGIDPSIEVRLKPLYIQTGIEHRCFHEIDRSDFGLVHWNKIFIGLPSPNYRPSGFRDNLLSDDAWSKWYNRLSWNVRWGYFAYSVFGLLQEEFLSRDNGKIHETNLDFRYALYHRKTWMFDARSKTTFGLWKDPGTKGFYYWRQDFMLESNFIRGKQGGLFFADFILDDLPLYHGLPRFSKDRLVQLGVKFFI